MQNFVNIAQFSQTDFRTLLNDAQQLLDFNTDHTKILKNKFIAHLFLNLALEPYAALTLQRNGSAPMLLI